MKEKLNPAAAGIPMRWVHLVTFVVVFILSVLIVLTSWQITDGFKSFNDTYGHETGDKVLTKVAYTLRGRFRSDDFICRIGGDEFAVIMTNASSSLRNMVEDKIQMANEILQSPKDGLPPSPSALA